MNAHAPEHPQHPYPQHPYPQYPYLSEDGDVR